MTVKDRRDAAKALARWFQSQRIAPGDAIPIMGMSIVSIVATLADDDDDAEKGLEAFIGDLRENMKEALA